MNIKRRPVIVGAAVIAIALGATVARTRAVKEWFDTVTVQGKMTAYLLDDGAAVNGLLLDGGQQVRLSPRLGAAIASLVKQGDPVSVVGRGGHGTSFGRLVDARAITINGQTVTLAGEPDGPRGGPRGRGGRGPADGPGGPHDGRGTPPAPGGRGEMNAPPPPRPQADVRPVPGEPRDDLPPPPAPADHPGENLTAILDLPFDDAVAALEKVLIRRALDASSGNRTEAARLLKINRRLLYSKMRDHDLG